MVFMSYFLSLKFRSKILREVANARISKLPHGKGIIVLGDNGTGKSTLVSRLSHRTVPDKTPGLEYHYVDVRDEATDGIMSMFTEIL